MTSGSTGRKNIVLNSAFNWANMAVQLVTAYFLSPVLVHGLGEGRYGEWATIEQLLAYLTLFDLGISNAIVRFVARFDESRDPRMVNRIFNTSLAALSTASAVGLAIVAVMLAPVFGPLPIVGGMDGDARWMAGLLAVNIAIQLTLGVFPALLNALGKFPALNTVRITRQVVQAGLLAAAVGGGGRLAQIAGIVLAMCVAEHVVLTWLAHRAMPGLRVSASFVGWDAFHEIRGYGLKAFVIQLANRVSFQSDSLVIRWAWPQEAVTHFVVGGRLVEYAKLSILAMTQVLTPTASVLFERGDRQAIRSLLLNGTRLVTYPAVLLQAGFMVLGAPFLQLWMGPTIAEASGPVLWILSLPLAIVLATAIAGRILYGVGDLRLLSVMSAGEAGANLVLSLLLVRSFGIKGVAWGTAIPSGLCAAALLFYTCRKQEVSLVELVRQSLLGPCSLVLLPLAVWWTIDESFRSADWWSFFLTAGLGAAAYGLGAALVELLVCGRLRSLGVRPSVLGADPGAAGGAEL
jgi:O-antigen/teichoic acid export membrane protein